MSFEINGFMDLDSIKELQRAVLRRHINGESSVFSEYIVSYCQSAIDYAEFFEDSDVEVRFSLDSIDTLLLGAMMLYVENTDKGMTEEESRVHLNEQLSGYLFFSVINSAYENGYDFDIAVNDYQDGLIIISEDDDGNRVELDIFEALDRAVDILEVCESEDGPSVVGCLDLFLEALFCDEEA